MRAQGKIAVAPCICRRERNLVGEGCDKPEEVCLSFGGAADFYERNGLGRPISQQEALDVLQAAEQAGLVLQPANAQKAAFICCCCGCCCGVLRNIKRHPQPATLVSTPFVAALNVETCQGCEGCDFIRESVASNPLHSVSEPPDSFLRHPRKETPLPIRPAFVSHYVIT